MSDITVKGYTVIQPLNPWDEKHRAEIVGHMSSSTFGRTPVEAWLRKTGRAQHDMEQSRIVQSYVERGYRLAEATMVIHDTQEEG